MAVAELRDKLDDVVDDVSANTSRAVITRDGEPVAALVSYFEFQLLDALKGRFDIAAFDEAMANDDGETVILSEFLKKHPVRLSIEDPTSP
ncbi:type II toxin-antitoxin system prevent-host-death family antitoxin [Corynebacterium xerosis]|uniref:type II toxin-antitoxin system prevent-host-death family antitoxin n=1 Tax=Corynebacterium xerosis TaxID=1725 RepID=UPI000EAD969C|nr:type II toxin-antitoxin system prevent-host-death family antitoxin [Corynebacterium xerosis]AYJ33550.1 type II toxin-antitoxin system prevent-host-death family antitoxin [Corynebacterium xerosis]